MRAIAENAWGQAQELKGIAAERRQILNFLAVQGPTDVASLGVERGNVVAAADKRLAYSPNIQREVHTLSLFAGYGEVIYHLLLEARLFHLDPIVAGRKTQEIVDSVSVASDLDRFVRFQVCEGDCGSLDNCALGIKNNALCPRAVLCVGWQSAERKNK